MASDKILVVQGLINAAQVEVGVQKNNCIVLVLTSAAV